MKLELIKASDVEIKEVEWLWYPYIPYGKVTVLQGDSGDGKSTFVLNLAAMLSRGEPMPFTDGSGQEPVNIIYQSSEDDADDTIVPRFVKAGGDPNRLIFISEKEKYLSFSDERLLEAVRKTNAKLIVLDPLSAYIGEETRINTANEIRRQFRPLIELAKEQRLRYSHRSPYEQGHRSESHQPQRRLGGHHCRRKKRPAHWAYRQGQTRRADTGAGQKQPCADGKCHRLFGE